MNHKRITYYATVLLTAMVSCSGGQAKAPFTPDPELQAERLALLKELIAEGVFTKIDESGGVPQAWAGPMFYQVDFEQKQMFANAVSSYFYPDPAEQSAKLVLIKDTSTGKDIGTHTRAFGLRME